MKQQQQETGIMRQHSFFSSPRTQAVLLGLVFSLSLHLTGLSLAEDTLSRLEQTLFSTSYPGESATQRLDRLESSVFGEPQAGTVASREAHLDQVLSNVRQNRPSTSQAEQPDNNAPQTIESKAQPDASQNIVTQEPDATSYPTVTALERQVFGRDFIRDDLPKRLDRLEKKVDGQPSPQLALADRVDRLLAKYPSIKPGNTAPPVVHVSPALQNLPDDASQFSGGSRDIYTKLDALERHQFHGKTYPNGLLTERLDRLEKKAFNRTYSGESLDSRINRLLGQYQVTANNNGSLPRPGFQQRQPYQSPGQVPQVITPSTGNAPPRQNIQIGGGFSSNSVSSYNFSPEMMSMLPPNVRSQVGSGNNSGSVVVERQTYNAPGFQNYGGAPIQHYNYYNAPGTQVQSQSTTTVIQPDGSQAVYGYPGNGANPNNPNGLPTPAYVGDPALLQSLNQLETHVFGQVNTVEPVPVRLGKLETALLGQMYVNMPDQQRLDNLENAYRVKAVSKLLSKNQNTRMGPGSGGGFFMGVPLGPNPLNPMNPMGMPTTMPINPGAFGW